MSIGNKLSPFKFWCQKVLPLAYDDSLSYYETLCKLTEYLNEVIQQINALTDSEEEFQQNLTQEWETYRTELTGVWEQYKTWIDNYFTNLDVQEEINNKLDAMASDGTLTNLIKSYVDPIYQAYETVINGQINTQNGRISVLESRMDTFSSLTEGSTTGDAELMGIRIGANGITYPSAGDAVRTLDSNLQEEINDIIVPTKNILKSLHYETGKLYDLNNSGFNKSDAPSSTWRAYDVIEFEAGKTYYYIYVRGYFTKIIYNDGTSARLESEDGSKYGSFTPLQSGRIGITSSAGGYNVFTEDINTYNEFLINAENTLNENLIIPQVDNISKNDSYFINRVNIIENSTIANNKGYDRNSASLTDNNATAAITEPIPVKAGVTYYYRNIWAYFCTILHNDGTKETITNDTEGMAFGSFTPNGSGNLYITLNKASRSVSSSNPDKVNKYLLTTSKDMYEDNVWHTQERIYEFHVGTNYKYTNLVEAIIEANKYMNSIVYIHDGEHDFISEIGDVFGSSYIESVDSTHRGVYLKNRINLIFASNASIVCNYTGSTQSVRQWLSVFNAGQHGFTLINATIKGSNLRYIIHDERDQDTEQYCNKYIECKMYFDNSENSDWNGNNCIGGGLGRNGNIVINDCYFNSVRRLNQEDSSEYARGIVTYHNSAGTGKNSINISNSYITNVGTFRITWYGTSPTTQKTLALIKGCSIGSNIIVRAEDSSALIENVEVINWNNNIRS